MLLNEESGHGTPRVLTLHDGSGFEVQVGEQGAAWLSCRVPLAAGQAAREVLLGHAEAALYGRLPGFLGVVVGRYANRIAGAAFETNGGGRAQLRANEGAHVLHGGAEGFDKRRWQMRELSDSAVSLELNSPDGDQGFPGELQARVSYQVSAPCTLDIGFEARCSLPCPVNLTSHAYFNLDAQHRDVRGHRLALQAAAMLPVDRELIPSGEIAPVSGTAFDFRQPRQIGQGPALGGVAGFDHCWVLDAACADGSSPAVELIGSDGAIRLRIATSYPGVQVYSGAHLGRTLDRAGQAYAAHAGIAIEPQYLPDSPNRGQRADWPQAGLWVHPGQVQRHFIRYTFEALSAEGASR